ncbi:hypothetical protein [Thermoleptolyngbya sp.]
MVNARPPVPLNRLPNRPSRHLPNPLQTSRPSRTSPRQIPRLRLDQWRVLLQNG